MNAVVAIGQSYAVGRWVQLIKGFTTTLGKNAPIERPPITSGRDAQQNEKVRRG